MLSCNEILKDIFAGYPTWSIGRSWGPAKGAARSPRRMESQPAWSGGGGTAFVTSGFVGSHQTCSSCDVQRAFFAAS